jgi:transposase
MVIGFMDETSPQTTANTQKLWSFHKSEIFKNTTKFRANTFGFYSINGSSVVDFKPHSKKEDVCEFLEEIRKENGDERVIAVLDNFPSHKAKKTLNLANDLGIDLVFLPPYSPDLNPIEFIWKSIKRVISGEFIRDLDHMKSIIRSTFEKLSSKLSFARGWIEKFLEQDLMCKILGS